MNKKIPLSILLAFLLLASIPATISIAFAGPPSATDPTALVVDTIGEPESVDPAWVYDTASSEVTQNIYETLAFYMVDRTLGPYIGGLTGTFTPKVANSWEFVDIEDYDANGVTIMSRYYFEINVGIPFHTGGDGTNWGTLTTADVEYSFERQLVQDRSGGPQWMIWEALFGTYGARSPTSDPNQGLKIDHAIESNSTHVWLNIATDFPPAIIMQINAYLGGIVCKAWAQSLGDLDISLISGGWTNWQDIYDRWNNPATSFIEYDETNSATKPVGTGAYKFDFWNHGTDWQISKFDAYWDGWPARVLEDPSGDNRLEGYITTVTWYYYPLWTTRRPRLLAGDADFSDVDRIYRDQVLGQPGIRCNYPISGMAVTGYFYTFDITTTSPYVPEFYASGTFGTNGIPADMFSDLDVRRGFAYAFDYDNWLTNVFLGEGWQPPDAVITGLAYNRDQALYPTLPYDETDPALLGPPYKYYYNMTKAEEHLKAAWGGDLWADGMKLTVCYNTGNVARQLAAEMITSKINSLNPKFQLDPPFAVPWGSTYLPQMVQGMLPIFIIGWGADYPDPHNFAYPFYHSTGTFAAWQRYNNPSMDALIEQGIATPDGLARLDVYRQIQELAVNDVPGVTLVQAQGRHFEADWVRGYYFHAITQDNFYHFWKGVSELGDANNDGDENIADKAYIASHWTGVAGLTYNPSADISGGVGGLAGGSVAGLVKGIYDGTVDIVDLGVLNAAWD